VICLSCVKVGCWESCCELIKVADVGVDEKSELLEFESVCILPGSLGPADVFPRPD